MQRPAGPHTKHDNLSHLSCTACCFTQSPTHMVMVSKSTRVRYLIAILQVPRQLLLSPLCGAPQGKSDKPMQAQPHLCPRLHRQTSPSSRRQRQLHQEVCSQQMNQHNGAHVTLQGVKLTLLVPQCQLLQWHLQLSSTQQAQSGMSWR